MAQVDVKVVVSAQDNASSVVKNLESNVKSTGATIADTFKTGGLAAGIFLGGLTALGAKAVSIASDFEQNRIAFETMTGSVEKGRKVLTELSNFAVKTPFELPQLMQASKSLLAYGIETKELIPTLTTLGNISAGVGMDKLPNLILAFGQVKAATKLTGMELRQFTEAGVPLLGALVDKANETGGVLTAMGGASKSVVKKIASLGSATEEARFKMQYLQETGKGNSEQFKDLGEKIKFNEARIKSFGSVGETVYAKVKVTAAQMKDAISDGAVSFDQVKAALEGMSGKGGRFFELMEKQSKTFGGTVSNIKDQVTRSLAEIVGIDIQAGGTIRKGSLFDVMKHLAFQFLEALNTITPKIVDFFKFLTSNQQAISVIAGAIGGALVLAIGAFIIAFGPAIAILLAFMAAGAAIGFIVSKLIEHFGGLNNIIKMLMPVWDALVLFFKNMASTFGPMVTDLFAKMQPALVNLGTAVQGLMPYLGMFLGAILTLTGALLSGFIGSIIEALPIFVQVIADAINVIVAIFELFGALLKGISTGDFTDFQKAWNKLWEAINKLLEDFVLLIWATIKGFIKGIINFFLSLYATLVGKTVPDIVDGIVEWFMTLDDKVVAVVKGLISNITGLFGNLVGAAANWGKNMISNMINGIKNAILGAGKLAGKLAEGLGFSLDDVKKFQTGGIVPGPIGEPQMAVVHGGESINPIGGSGSGGSGGGGVIFNVNIGMYAGTDIEKRNVAKELYSALMQLSQSQHKTVQEFMGG